MTAPNDEALAGDATQGSMGVAQSVSHPCAPSGANHKSELNMQARAALAGCGMYRLADGDFLLTKYGMTKTCPDLRSVGALLDRLAGTA